MFQAEVRGSFVEHQETLKHDWNATSAMILLSITLFAQQQKKTLIPSSTQTDCKPSTKEVGTHVWVATPG